MIIIESQRSLPNANLQKDTVAIDNENQAFLLTNIYLSSIPSKEVQVRTLTMRFIKV